MEKSYTFLFKDTSLEFISPNPLDVLPKQNWVWKSTVLLSALNVKNFYEFFINKQKTIIMIVT